MLLYSRPCSSFSQSQQNLVTVTFLPIQKIEWTHVKSRPLQKDRCFDEFLIEKKTHRSFDESSSKFRWEIWEPNGMIWSTTLAGRLSNRGIRVTEPCAALRCPIMSFAGCPSFILPSAAQSAVIWLSDFSSKFRWLYSSKFRWEFLRWETHRYEEVWAGVTSCGVENSGRRKLNV